MGYVCLRGSGEHAGLARLPYGQLARLRVCQLFRLPHLTQTGARLPDRHIARLPYGQIARLPGLLETVGRLPH